MHGFAARQGGPPSSIAGDWGNRVRGSRMELSIGNRMARTLWSVVWLLFYRPSPAIAHGWRRTLLRLFGARIGRGAAPYPAARIWAPWNLEMGTGSCIANFVDCYSVDKIVLGPGAVVSQHCHLCSASHDYGAIPMPLIAAPIRVEKNAWVTAGAFIGPGVTVGEGAVVGARAVVTRDVAAWSIVAGNPARPIGARDPIS